MKAKELYIYGAGGFGKELLSLLSFLNAELLRWIPVGFFDDKQEAGTYVNGLEVLGDIKDLKEIAKFGQFNLVVAIGDPERRAEVVSSLEGININFPILVHPRALISDEVQIGSGTIITANAIVSNNVIIGRHSIVNFNSVIGHNTNLGSFCSVMAGVQIGGEVEIGERCFLGLQSVVIDRKALGNGCFVGAGAVVNRNVADGMAVVNPAPLYVPYERLKHKPKE
jgi:sugar O-acyltransferase (sialic acid O-acetyltransferase NeuD family)